MGPSRVSLNEEQNDRETDDSAAAVGYLSMNALYVSVSVKGLSVDWSSWFCEFAVY